ncbi:MAG: acyl carrier protein [Bacteroidales bacterium]|nr:acyl carrier protein [Bacteroidales bacterium]
MTNIEKYNEVFKSTFNVEDSALNGDLAAGRTDKWDSITHLSLVTNIEDEFEIMLDSEDILEFRSYEGGKLILRKYDVQL